MSHLATKKLSKSLKLPQRFFVYGTLRDDLDENAPWTEHWINGVSIAWNAKVHGFKMYKSKHLNYPFAVRTNDMNDHIFGRLMQWNDEQTFYEKLAEADDIEDYDTEHPDDENNEYIRNVVDVHILSNNHHRSVMKAIMYYQTMFIWNECDEIPNGNWTHRHFLKYKVKSHL